LHTLSEFHNDYRADEPNSYVYKLKSELSHIVTCACKTGYEEPNYTPRNEPKASPDEEYPSYNGCQSLEYLWHFLPPKNLLVLARIIEFGVSCQDMMCASWSENALSNRRFFKGHVMRLPKKSRFSLKNDNLGKFLISNHSQLTFK